MGGIVTFQAANFLTIDECKKCNKEEPYITYKNLTDEFRAQYETQFETLKNLDANKLKSLKSKNYTNFTKLSTQTNDLNIHLTAKLFQQKQFFKIIENLVHCIQQKCHIKKKSKLKNSIEMGILEFSDITKNKNQQESKVVKQGLLKLAKILNLDITEINKISNNLKKLKKSIKNQKLKTGKPLKNHSKTQKNY